MSSFNLSNGHHSHDDNLFFSSVSTLRTAKTTMAMAACSPHSSPGSRSSGSLLIASPPSLHYRPPVNVIVVQDQSDLITASLHPKANDNLDEKPAFRLQPRHKSLGGDPSGRGRKRRAHPPATMVELATSPVVSLLPSMMATASPRTDTAVEYLQALSLQSPQSSQHSSLDRSSFSRYSGSSILRTFSDSPPHQLSSMSPPPRRAPIRILSSAERKPFPTSSQHQTPMRPPLPNKVPPSISTIGTPTEPSILMASTSVVSSPHTPLPSITLTPRSSVTRGSGLPAFPSPFEEARLPTPESRLSFLPLGFDDDADQGVDIEIPTGFSILSNPMEDLLFDADQGSLSDDDDDEAMVLVPPSHVKMSEPSTKKSRRVETQSFPSATSLLGVGFVTSCASLRGMEPGSRTTSFQELTREESQVSIGLNLDVQASRDLSTPPAMTQALSPPPLSPHRYGRSVEDTISEETSMSPNT